MQNHNIAIEPLTASSYNELIEIWEASVRATHLFLSEEDIAFYKPVVLKYALPGVSLYGIREGNAHTWFMESQRTKLKCFS